MQPSILSVVWFAREPAHPETRPRFHERLHRCELPIAVEHAVEKSTTTGFMLGQVLAADGLVLATVAPGGAYMLAASS